MQSSLDICYSWILSLRLNRTGEYHANLCVTELTSAARRPKVGGGGGALIPAGRRRRRVQKVGVGGAARPAQGSSHNFIPPAKKKSSLK